MGSITWPELKNMSLSIFDDMFGGKVRPAGPKGLRQTRNGKLLFIEQNPNKGSKWAVAAKGGCKIMWVIHDQLGYIARIVDSKFTRL